MQQTALPPDTVRAIFPAAGSSLHACEPPRAVAVPALLVLAGEGAGSEHDAVVLEFGLVRDVVIEVVQDGLQAVGGVGEHDVEAFGEKVVGLGVGDEVLPGHGRCGHSCSP